MFAPGAQLDWRHNPLDMLRAWPTDRPVVMLHSGRYDSSWARRSIVAEPAGRFVYVADCERSGSTTGMSQWIHHAGESHPPAFTHRPFADLRQLVQSLPGLWIGSLSYDLGRWVECLPTIAGDDRHWPIIELAWCPVWFVHDTRDNTWQCCGDVNHLSAEGPTAAAQRVPPLARHSINDVDVSPPVSNASRQEHEATVTRAIDYIAAGDVFQVNLAQRMTSDVNGPFPFAPRQLFSRLAAVSPAWYGAYLEWPGDEGAGLRDRAVLSTSPELFLQLDPGRRVVTRPIKGTRPAHSTVGELRDSIKDEAELNMIVDLMRNDLGRVCDYGSVRVADARAIESHPTVHHGVATIEGRLHRTKDAIDLLRATFPGGSVTGAPKVRAMQIIDELEPVRRGPYCGAIGCLSRDAMQLNVAIRTMMYDQLSADKARIDFSVGGGIVADSKPAAEYQETLDKAAAMMAALHSASPDTAAPQRHSPTPAATYY